MSKLRDERLLAEIKRCACLFFYEAADPATGLINDRANNYTGEKNNVASIASTGYGLTALTIAAENAYLSKPLAYQRALLTLTFLNYEFQHVQGWYYHFVDKRTGKRVWNCELSSIDTALLVIGALICGQYFEKTEVQELANNLYEKINWQWMLTNAGEDPNKVLLSHGWKPESGFLKSNWDSYCELMFLYLLGIGARNSPLPLESWKGWERPLVNYKDRTTLTGGPIFIHQMAHGFYNFQDQRDPQGWNYWETSVEATYINREFCLDNQYRRKTYSENTWGLNACDHPEGYAVSSAPGSEDGTVSPSGAVASIIFTPDLSIEAANEFYNRFNAELWGNYGFGNALNVDKDWYDKEVIGIDLGMLLINIENRRSGMIWKLLETHCSTKAAWRKVGFS
jgi:hypothetical protein